MIATANKVVRASLDRLFQLVGRGGSPNERVRPASLTEEEKARLADFEGAIRQYGRRVSSLVRASEPHVLSVLIPARAAEHYIGDCLASILGQAVPPGIELEVLVGVDGCESTRDAIDRYLAGAGSAHAQRVRAIYFPRQYGSYVMQNSLLLESRGAHVQIVGADDALAPEALMRLWRHAERCRARSPAFIIRTTGLCCDERLTPIARRKPLVCKGAMFYPKCVLDTLGGYAPWVCAADADFLARAEAAGIPVHTLSKVAYLYRLHGDQMTRGTRTGAKSGLRAHYARLQESRVASAEVREPPIVGERDETRPIG